MTKARKRAASSGAPFEHPDWPAANGITMVKVEKITPHPRNPRTHPDAQVGALSESHKEFGVVMPMVLDEKFQLIAGEGRWMTAKRDGLEEYPAIIVRGWSEEKKLAFMVADNQLPQLAGFDQAKLQGLVAELQELEVPMLALGFDPPALQALMLPTAEDPGDEGERGELLELVNITIAEPKHQVARGEHYMLAGRHHLVVDHVVTGWPRWAPLLKDDALFAPYPGVFVVFGHKAAKHPLVMVQPDPYIAGHILDRFQEVHGKKAIKRVSP